jgi:hypothetical protein
MQRERLPLSRKTPIILSKSYNQPCAPSRKEKTKVKKLAADKKSSDVASKEIEKESKKSTRTSSSKKSAQEKRKKVLSSSGCKKMKHLSTLHPVKVRLLNGEEDYSFTNKDTSETEDEVIETVKKTSALVRKIVDNITNHDSISHQPPTQILRCDA